MRCNPSKGNLCMRFVSGTFLLCLASTAGAVTTLVGGGSTLPAVAYTGRATFPAPLTPITPSAGSLFGNYTIAGGNPVTYCPDGSGTGKQVLAGNDPNFQVNGVCGASPPAVSGFGGSGLLQAHFAASDAPLSSSEFNAYVVGHGSGTQPTQLPAIAGAIAIIFKKAGINALTLSEGQICGIFSGQITDWSTLAPGTSGPINVVYRRDSSGTSFSFLNHLSAICPINAAPGNVAALNFKTNQNFSGLDTLGNSTGASAYIPLYASSLPVGGASGNAGVTTAVNVTDGSIGYVITADAIVAPARVASVTNSHTHVSVNPTSGFGSTAMAVSLVYDKVIADAVDPNGRPVLSSLALTNQCVAMVDPSTYADPAAGYPILAISYLLANAQTNGADTAAVRSLLFSPYNTTLRPPSHVNNGYAWLSNTGLASPTIQSKIASCVN